ncbi:MAG: DUF971 domain-containing protein [Gammaproteobacteria bacterium]|nr:DUF971 domain-containing protein [Gammaproteobacteria bacterium]
MKIPTTVQLHRQSRTLELGYAEGENYQLSCELLRVCSPSAEVRGHGQGQEVLQTGKKNVSISEIKGVGNYALQLCFDDGHDTGLYSWDYLYELCQRQDHYWDQYLAQMHAAGASRDPDMQVIQFDP